ncbi:hypothetical protein L5515_000898 [Caenorhabditis briggsae]|uniref:Uncharacterized protein n=1 Tax=Caenorhabditis briggsae TaxID=6238 RepID=A0AAE9J247_CAEBR|nr:hypothetical protein L5515_000898 [Caenorhabditis briggsae]
MDSLALLVLLPAISIIFECCGKKKRKEKSTTPSKEIKDSPVTPASPEIIQKPDEMAKDKTKSMKSEKNSEKKTKSEDKKSNDKDVEKGNKTKSEKEKKTEEEKKSEKKTKDNEDKEKEKKNEPKKNDEKQAVISDPIVTPETDEYPTLEDDVEQSKNKSVHPVLPCPHTLYTRVHPPRLENERRVKQCVERGECKETGIKKMA